MATFLKAHETRNLALSVTASVIAGIATILIAGTYMARKGSEQTIARTMTIQQRPRIEEIGIKDTSDISKKLSVNITTNESYDYAWSPVLMHRFYANSEEELENLIQAHKMTDTFFAASFKGVFHWKGTKIELKNIVQYN